MKILFIASYSGTSGANHSLITLIKILKAKGVEPLVLLPKKGEIESLLVRNRINYKIVRMFNWIIPLKSEYSKVEKLKWLFKKIINSLQEIRILFLIKRKKIDIVHINAITASWGAIAAKLLNVPLVWHIREFLEEDLNKKFFNRKASISRIKKADYVIAISKSVYNKYSKIHINNRLEVIYNGVNHHNYKEIKNNTFKRDNIVLTISGRIVKEKGHEELINAINYLVKKGMNNIKLKIVGNEGDAKFISKVKKVIEEQNLENVVNFLGYRKDMLKIWSETDIAIVSSKAEAFGRVTIEAMMAGALVIGADTEGTAELIDGKYGLIYEQGDYKSLADSIDYAVNNKVEMVEITEKARKYAIKNFTADLNAKKIYKVYEEALKYKN